MVTMPEEAAKKVKEVAHGVKEETRKLIEETRRARHELTPRPIRNWLRERFRRR